MTKKIKIPTDEAIYEECRARYYCSYDEDDEMYNQLCEEYECWDDEDVEKLIKDDVMAMKRFLEHR